MNKQYMEDAQEQQASVSMIKKNNYRMKSNDNRSKLLAMIHMQKKDLHLDDEAYRAILAGETSHESCVDCTMGELFTVFNALNNVLLSRGKIPYRFFPSAYKTTLRDAVHTRAKKILGVHAATRLQKFIQMKLQKKSLAECTDRELRRVMGFLSSIERNDNKKHSGGSK